MDIDKQTFTRIIRATAEGVNWQEVALTLATLNPDLFIEILDTVNGQNYKMQAQVMANDGHTMVDVVKYVRDARGLSLKDARDWVVNYINFPENHSVE